MLAESAHHRRLEQRRVGLRGAVDRERPRGYAVAPGGPAGRAVQCGEHRRERRRGGGVLDDAAALGVPAERVGEAECLSQPVEHHLLELGRRRAGRPDHPLGADAAGEQVAEHAGGGGVGREVGEEPRVLPVRQAADQVGVEVGQHRVEGLGLLGGAGRQRGRHLAGLHLREHRQVVDGCPVVGDPVDHPVALLAELLRRQVRRAHAQTKHRFVGAAQRDRKSAARIRRRIGVHAPHHVLVAIIADHDQPEPLVQGLGPRVVLLDRQPEPASRSRPPRPSGRG